jgi:hypothetical protein
MTHSERMTSEARVDPSVKRAWEPMSLTRIGTFGDVLQGNTGSQGDGGGTMKKPTG